MMPVIHVEVAYATPEKQKIITVSVEAGSVMFDVAKQSGIHHLFPEIDLDYAIMGIFGQIESAPKTRVVKEGDRIEIYRPLQADPKETRRRRAAVARSGLSGLAT